MKRIGSEARQHTAASEPTLARKPRTYRQIVWRELRRNRGAMISMVVLLALAIVGIIAPVIAPFDPLKMEPSKQFCPPSLEGELLGWDASDREVYDTPHYMGCDEYGRDVFSRVLNGTSYSLQVALICTAIGLAGGTVVGLISGYLGGTTDFVIQRFVDILYALPGILLAMAIIAIIGPGLYNVMLAIGISWIPIFARLARGSVLSTKQELYVEAARCSGVKTGRMLRRHILPNVASPLIVLGSMAIGGAILTAATLSFLGMGVQPPKPEWGIILNQGREYMRQAPWITIFPGLFISITVLAVNIFGDGLRSALDPRMKID